VVRARDWVPDEEFADSHHQLPDGAGRFSGRLAREVIAPRLARVGWTPSAAAATFSRESCR
jgi:hypothetical protein